MKPWPRFRNRDEYSLAFLIGALMTFDGIEIWNHSIVQMIVLSIGVFFYTALMIIVVANRLKK